MTLTNPTLNLQTIVSSSTGNTKQQMILNQESTLGKEQIAKNEQLQGSKILTNISVPDEKEAQHFLKA